MDQRIRRLDKDVKIFDTEIGKQRALLGLPVRHWLPLSVSSKLLALSAS